MSEFHVGAFENGKASEESRCRALHGCFPAGGGGGVEGGGGGCKPPPPPPTGPGAAPQSFQIITSFHMKSGWFLVDSQSRLPELVVLWWFFAKFSSRFQSLPVPISISSYENDVFFLCQFFLLTDILAGYE